MVGKPGISRPGTRLLPKKKINDFFDKDEPIDDDIEVQVFPEISAAIYSLIENQVDRDNGQPYIMFDVGAGTVDISAFEFHKGRHESAFHTTMFEPCVKNLGTSFCHRNRIRSAKEEIRSLIDLEHKKREEILNLLEQEEILLSSTYLPNMLKDYFNGVEHNKDSDALAWFPDNFQIIGELAKNLRQHMLSYKDVLSVTGRESMEIKILSSGGGAQHPVYMEALKRVGYLKKGYSSVQPCQKTLPKKLKAKSLMPSDFWARLNVAYGLSMDKLDSITIEKFPTKEKEYSTKVNLPIWIE